MSKQKMTASQQDDVQYRRAKTWQIALSQLFGAAQMCFYMVLTYATYIGNAGYGIVVGVTGIIITASRLVDGVTDPVCAYIVERFQSRFGKIRIVLLTGWAIMSLATTAMCTWGAGHLSGIAGLVFFIVCYMVYIIGYTLSCIAGSMVGPVITNDPRQRPTVSVWNTIYSYIGPMVISMISMAVLLPRFDNQVSTPFLSAFNLVAVALSLVMYLISCIGITPYDKPEYFAGVKTTQSDAEKPSFKDMWALLKDNKELQRYIISACSDKLAQTIGSVSVISVMLYGIMIGNYDISITISTVAMLPSIVFAIIGAKIAGKRGNMKTMVEWSYVCIVFNALYSVFLLFTDTTQITVALIPSALFFLFTFGRGGINMIVSTATTALRMDLVDYELYRSGKYMPATVSAVYSFADKLISAIGPTIATFMIGFIGYTTTTPQAGDPLTTGVKVMTVLLLNGFPIIGWVATIIAQRNSQLTKEKMVEVQRVNKERQGGI